MRSLLLPRQSRPRFVKERDDRKSQNLSNVAELPGQVLDPTARTTAA
jgi:hypothetical protein